jgi:myo-inositol-1(or 4)-monophosphatase
VSYEKELEIAIQGVFEAGEVLIEYFDKKNYKVRYKSKSGKGSPVTDADIKSNEILKSKIASSFPDDGWLSEETVDDKTRLGKKRVWVIDPLDGTSDFLKGIPEFSISVALVEDKNPVLGVVYNPVNGELYFGIKGNGAYLRKIKTQELIKLGSNENLIKNDIKNASIILSRKELSQVEKLEVLVKKFKETKFRESIAYKIVSVASGWADAVVSMFNKSEWDLAGAHIIAEEAGLKVTDSYGNKILYNNENIRRKGVIVANQNLHDEILKILKEN